MSGAHKSPGQQMGRVLSGNYGLIERANDHYLLIDGGVGADDECGLIFLNENWAFYDRKIMRHGYARQILKKALKADGSFESSNRRDIWPGKYQHVRFYEDEP
jgi:hypothetical protein